MLRAKVTLLGVVLAVTAWMSRPLVAEDKDREAKEKRLADLFGEVLDLLAEDPLELTEEEDEKRDQRVKSLNDAFESLVKDLGLDSAEGEKEMEKLLEKHRPDVAVKKRAMDEERRESECTWNLKKLGMAVGDWESEKGSWPEGLGLLTKENRVEDASILKCPLHGGEYVYRKPAVGGEAPRDGVLLYCSKTHASGRRCFSTNAGSCQAVLDAAFEKILMNGRIEGVAHRIVVESVELIPRDKGRTLKMRVKATGLFAPAEGKARGTMRAEVMLDRKEGQVPGVTKFAAAAEGSADAIFEFEIPIPKQGGYPYVLLKATDSVSNLIVEHAITDAGRGGK